MRTLLVVSVAAILGIAVGVGTTWARLGRAPDFSSEFDLLTSTSRTATEPAEPSGPQPVVSVDTESHDFGVVERNHVVEHSFVFTNRGQGPLELKSGGTTCLKCTVSKIPESAIPPGKTANVVVEYNASIDSPQFRQSATILTNDPGQPRVVLTVTGKVASSVSITPHDLVLSKVTANTSESATARVVSYLTDEFKIESFAWSDPESASFFDVKMAAVPVAELTEPHAKAGYDVTVTVKPGLPLGTFRQKLTLNTDLPSAPTLQVPVEGTVISDITISGSGWDREHGVLVLGVVRSAEGIRRNLSILVHGEHRHDLKISVGKCEPDFLRVSLGEPVDVNGGAVVRIPLSVEVPPGAPDANFLGSPGKLATIILETTHPEAKQVRMLVQLAVEQ
jgi:hypothetical protein